MELNSAVDQTCGITNLEMDGTGDCSASLLGRETLLKIIYLKESWS